ncbi:Cation/H(+) antiporter 17 [Smittium culicis]|uniref:Cation/H(+) antiporter 17 n=1 Tax=Smittium culicis TaxID=133412 RepID=A0A1R1Y121_9FUNG|nr:Cation/H(+) antiporter 17 [Smittium culicis]
MGSSGVTSIIDGMNPLAPNSSNPITLFLIQMSFIVCVSRILNLVFKPLNQPRVISEIVGGIILGPTALGKIDAFKNTVFPTSTLTYLNLVSNLGLILFLFIIGLELDIHTLKSQIKKSALISIAGMIVPFIAGALISFLLYNSFQNSGKFFVFLLFCGVSISITAFPVLARILSELGMLKTTVGFATITAASVDDVTAWILLALVIALSGNSSGLSALWIFLVGVAYVSFVFFVIQRYYIKHLNTQGFLNGRDPNPQIVFITFLMVFISAWFTDVLGIHAIFGAYIIGVIVPHNGGFAIKIAEKIEDLISIFFLPVYFALSGLNTNLGLLNSGKAWLMLVLTVFASFFGKILGCSLAARYEKFTWRESLTIGVLMSCKGLVELIVLNIGLKANVINESVFSILVLSALITTFTTTPIVKFIYPRSIYKYVDDDKFDSHTNADRITIYQKDKNNFYRPDFGALIVLNRQKQLPSIITLLSLFTNTAGEPSNTKNNGSIISKAASNFQFFFLRLIEMTARETSVMLHAESENHEFNDPVLATFRAFSQVCNISSTLQLTVSDKDSFADNIIGYANTHNADFIVIPALGKVDTTSETNYEQYSEFIPDVNLSSYSKSTQIELINTLFSRANSSVGIFINKGLVPAGFSQEELNFNRKIKPTVNEQIEITEYEDENTLKSSDLKLFFTENLDTSLPIIYVPFFGGPDDICALKNTVNLCSCSRVNILIVYYCLSNDGINENSGLSIEDFNELSPFVHTPKNALILDSPVNNFKSHESPSSRHKILNNLTPVPQFINNTKTKLSEIESDDIYDGKDDVLFLEDFLGLDLSVDLNQIPEKDISPIIVSNEVASRNSSTQKGLDSNTPEISANQTKLLNEYKLPDLKSQEDNSINKGVFTDIGNFFKLGSANKNSKTSLTDVDNYNTKNIKEDTLHLNQNPNSNSKVKDMKTEKYTFQSYKSTLFSNVSFRVLKTNSPLLTSLSHTLVLRNCDMVIFGRNIRDDNFTKQKYLQTPELGSISPAKFPNHSFELKKNSILNSFRVKESERKAIGVFGERLLGIKCRASKLVIQSESPGFTKDSEMSNEENISSKA